jgi:EAL domain-containing protein (putative c-di-GMP-specific phosphodiesterase class I)
VQLDDGPVVGAEALVRWNHPIRGLLSPAELLPATEQAGLLRPSTQQGAPSSSRHGPFRIWQGQPRVPP